MASAKPTNGPEKVTNTPKEMEDLKPMNEPGKKPAPKEINTPSKTKKKGKEVVERGDFTIYR